MSWQELFAITVNHGYIPQIFFAELIFFLHVDRKEHFVRRVAVGLPIFLLAAVVLPNLIAKHVSGFFSLTIFLLSILFWRSCIDADFSQLLFRFIAAQLIQNLSYHIENLFYLPFADYFTYLGRLIWSVVCMVGVYTAAYHFLVRRLDFSSDSDAHKMLNQQFVFLFSIVTTLFVYLMQYLYRVYQVDQLWISRPPLILCCIFALCVQFGYLALGREQKNNLMLEQMIAKEQHQMEITQESMDAINRKAHDLKHQIIRLRSMALADETELQEIADAVAQYETTFHTGNNTLDTILSDKQLVCNQHTIELSVMAQGEIINFLRPGEIASLFGNALDNAIEFEMKIENAAQRCISLQLFESKGLICIQVENYCPQETHWQTELPTTTKPGRLDHGFGLRSIQYIAQQHHGSLHVSWEHGFFVLRVLIPCTNA